MYFANGFPQFPHLDAAENLFFERQLESVAAKSYDVKYPQLKGRQFVPVNNQVDRGAETHKFMQYDMAGVAKIISNYADDLPASDVKGKEFRVPIKTLGGSFHYNVQEIQNARFAGLPLEQRKANACRRSIEELIDKIIATGDTDTGIVGLFALANTLVYTVPQGASTHTDWARKTPLEILADLVSITSLIVETTNEVEVPDTLILPVAQRQIITNTPISLAGATSVSIEKYFLDTNPYIKTIEQWYKAKGAGVSSADRMVCYRRDPDALQVIIPLEAEFLPPQAKGLAFQIPAWARCAGVITYYPMSIAYGDGI
jgi:hypothetical protein